jgi:hypothetical protein
LIALRSHFSCLSMLMQWYVLLSQDDLLVPHPRHGIDPRVLNYLDIMLLLILHSLQIVQILDGVLELVKSFDTVVMIVCQHLLRCLLSHFLWDCYYFYFHL